MQESRPRKTRGRGLRTTTGCITCRKRHLKCDEKKPICEQCLRNQKTCNYPNAVRGSSQEPRSQGEGIAPQHEELQVDPSVSRDTSEPPYPSLEETEADDDLTQAEGDPPRPAFHTVEGDAQEDISENPTSIEVELQDAAQNFNYTSPLSCGTGDQPIGVATARWFGMLAGDTNLDLDLLTNIPSTSSAGAHHFGEPSQPGVSQFDEDGPQYLVSSLPNILPRSSERNVSATFPWQSSYPLALTPPEQRLFSSFVTHISQWLDLFDPVKHFSALVPKLALHNVGLMNAILALSLRHNCLRSASSLQPLSSGGDALQYYSETLQYLRKALRHETFHTSLELLATTLIISAFEMLGDGSSRDWEQHLQGVFWIQRSQVIHGDSGGLKGAIWWTWLCQDVWAAFRDKRRVFTFWAPQRTLRELSPAELAARSVFLLGKVINYCAHAEPGDISAHIQTRIHVADTLSATLDEWESLLQPEFSPLPYGEAMPSTIFSPVWIYPVPYAVAMQVHHVCRVLILLHRPSLGGIREAMQRQIALDRHVDIICGIALGLEDYASSTICSQCLFIAGLGTYDKQRRAEILGLIQSCTARTGWPATPLDEDLKRMWQGAETNSS